RLPRGDVDRAERPGHGRDGLERRAHAQDLAVAHPALDAAGAVRLAPDAAVLGAGDLVVGDGAAARGRAEPVADLDALDGLDAHERAGEARVELAVAVDVGAEARREAVGEDLDDTPQGVAGLLAGVDLVDH